MSLDRSAALMSISMGPPQIMGFNHKLIGYSTVQQRAREWFLAPVTR